MQPDSKFMGRYFLVFVGVFVIMSALLVFKVLSEQGYISLINVLLGSFFGGGAITAIANAIKPVDNTTQK